MTPSDSVSAAVQRWVDRLDHLDARIVRCTVVIERPNASHRHGEPFHVRIELALRERTLEITRDPGREAAHVNVYAAINDAFRAARRKLRDHVRTPRGSIKPAG
jgi:hypothetical protein